MVIIFCVFSGDEERRLDENCSSMGFLLDRTIPTDGDCLFRVMIRSIRTYVEDSGQLFYYKSLGLQCTPESEDTDILTLR